MDGTGVPVAKKETVDRKGKTEGQPSHAREAKLGCVFTQTQWDDEGYAIETAEKFGNHIYAEAWTRGWSRAERYHLLGYFILIAGLALGAHLLPVPPKWIGAGVIILAGTGVLSGVKNARGRDAA